MEILATIPVYTYPWFYNLLIVLAVIFIVVGISFAFSSIELNSCAPLVIGIILIAIGILGIFLTNKAIDNASVFDYNKYKVTIDDSVSAKELLNEYEILSREGEIFTIKEIEVDE